MFLLCWIYSSTFTVHSHDIGDWHVLPSTLWIERNRGEPVNHDVGWINGALAKFMAFHGTAWHSKVEFRAALRMPLGCFSGSSGLWFQHIYMMNTGIMMSSVTQRDPSKPSAEVVVFQNWTQTRKDRCVHLPDKTIKWEIWRNHINII